MLLQLFRPSGTTRPLFRGFMAPEFSGVYSTTFWWAAVEILLMNINSAELLRTSNWTLLNDQHEFH
jgi:hypothetical protein